MSVFQFFIIYKRTNNANNATHYVKLGKKRRESSKRNYYIISPRVIIKAIIIIRRRQRGRRSGWGGKRRGRKEEGCDQSRRQCHYAVLTSKVLNVFGARFVRSWHSAAAFSLQVPNSCVDLDKLSSYVLILGTYSKFAWINTMLALGVCFPQPCLNAGPSFATSRSRLNQYWTNILFPQKQIRWNVL